MDSQINPAFYLNLLRSKHNLLAVKSEFEAEGSTLEELCTLSTFCNDASVPLTIKVGGSSAKRDFSEAIEIGAKIILVPMIESTESLRLAVDNFLHFSKIFRSPTLKPLLYINIETKTAAVSSSKIKDFILSENLPVSGVVIGRSDLAASMGVHSVIT